MTKDPTTPKSTLQRTFRLLIVMTASLYLWSAGLSLVGWVWNHNRIVDIQQSRVASCQRTYQAFEQVFKPFFPPPAHRTPAQQKALEKFENTIARLKGHCVKQTAS